MYYTMCPSLYLSPTFVSWSGDILQSTLPNMKFASISDALICAKKTGVALREENWQIYEWHWIFKKRISLLMLYHLGYFSNEISKDSIGFNYNWK